MGCSNREVRYRDVDSDCLNRIHRACDDCGQNEAERSNVCIGDALVDGGTLRWKFHEALDGLTQAEIENHFPLMILGNAKGWQWNKYMHGWLLRMLLTESTMSPVQLEIISNHFIL